ncbi:MAG: hypothetical protein ABEJ83_04600, partial [Candidatus Nanohaloarchaea archaeon]
VYLSKLVEDLEMSKSQIRDVIRSLEKEGLIKKEQMENSRRKELKLDKSLVSVFEDIWDLNSTPDEFQSFLEEYVSAYVGFEASSSIKDMLRDDFAEALLSYERNNSLPEWLQNLRSDLSGELEAYRPKEDYVEKALR